MQRCQRRRIASALVGCDQGIDRGLGAGEIAESPDEVHQFARFQKNESARGVVIRQGPECLVAKRDLRVESPVLRRVKGVDARQ